MADEQAPSREAPYLAAGDRLRLARLREGWTTRDVAAGTGIDHGNIARWERGEGKPGPRNLLIIVKYLGLDIDEMLAQYDELAAA